MAGIYTVPKSVNMDYKLYWGTSQNNKPKSKENNKSTPKKYNVEIQRADGKCEIRKDVEKNGVAIKSGDKLNLGDDEFIDLGFKSNVLLSIDGKQYMIKGLLRKKLKDIIDNKDYFYDPLESLKDFPEKAQKAIKKVDKDMEEKLKNWKPSNSTQGSPRA